MLVGNKCDMEDERVISFERGRQLADSLGLEFFETSAKENINVRVSVTTISQVFSITHYLLDVPWSALQVCLACVCHCEPLKKHASHQAATVFRLSALP